MYNFLANTIDIRCSNLIDELAAKDILSPAEKQKIKKQKKPDAKVSSLLTMLREKSAVQFKSFLTLLFSVKQVNSQSLILYAWYFAQSVKLDTIL